MLQRLLDSTKIQISSYVGRNEVIHFFPMPKSLQRTGLRQQGEANENNHTLAFTVLGNKHFSIITLFDFHNHPRRFYSSIPTLKTGDTED